MAYSTGLAEPAPIRSVSLNQKNPWKIIIFLKQYKRLSDI